MTATVTTEPLSPCTARPARNAAAAPHRVTRRRLVRFRRSPPSP